MRKDIGYLLKSINDKLEVKGNADMAKFGLTFPQSRVLAVLHDSGGKMTQKELECSLEVSHPTVTGLVSRMQKQGFLDTRQSETDRRYKIITLTDKARSVGEELDRAVEKNSQIMLAGLSVEQVGALYDMLTIIDRNISR